tara:strand:- start:284 stop:1075 length:792 start_codon:yes stop_codon:yes gene_type:complete
MKTPAWNSTNEEFKLYYDFNNNFDRLLPYYMNSSSVKNKFKTNKSYEAVYRFQMKNLYECGELNKPRMKKMINWLKEDHGSKLRKRDLQNHNEQGKIMDMKDKENDKLNRDLQEAKATILDLQNQLNREKIKVKELQLNYEKLSLNKEVVEPIIQHNQHNQYNREPIEKNTAYSMASTKNKSVSKEVMETSFDMEKKIMCKDLLKQYNETEKTLKDKNQILDKFYDWLTENDEEDFDENDEYEMFQETIKAQASMEDSDEDIF